MTTLPLDDLKAIRRSAGTTLNDVYLAVCGGALRRYLLDGGAARPPAGGERPGVDRPECHPLSGNHVDNLYVSIGTDIADPLERLRHIHDVAAASKEVRSCSATTFWRSGPTSSRRSCTLHRADVEPIRLADHMRPPVNVVLSNVAGPRQQHPRTAIARGHLLGGTILEGIGLNITAWSYATRCTSRCWAARPVFPIRGRLPPSPPRRPGRAASGGRVAGAGR